MEGVHLARTSDSESPISAHSERGYYGAHQMVLIRSVASQSLNRTSSHAGASLQGGLGSPLLPEVVPETDANPLKFYRGGKGSAPRNLLYA